MSEPYGLLVQVRLRAGCEARYDALVAQTVERIRENEPGTVVYASHATDDPLARLCYELYRDRAAFEAHERSDYVQEFLAERATLLTEPPAVTVLRPGPTALQALD